ncbi:ABC transporter permease [Marivirga sp. S37H4]|uniref:ABC transporter permease n=1 Tax=Marivirga aurantiaca TaxID=2802615 RepID=A0A934X004_9BACT|nr:ABC transporter permease [Marivirga aurantiaca]MBK6266363.1 ABC transporter permease [Marivirga aurantiaca]
MLKNYLKIAWRNLRKHKLYSAINIVGLSVGVACSLMIALYVLHEMSYDNFHKNADNIYRLNRDIKVGENYYHFAISPAPVASFLKEEIPEVTKAVRLRTVGSFLVKRPEMSQSFKETKLICADSGFFDLFSFQLLKGNPSQQLKEPNTIVLSQKMADKYFLDENPLNKSLVLDGDETYKITGVFENMPENSHIKYDFLISMSSIPDQASNSSWTSNNFFTYYELRDDANLQNVIDKINQKSDAELAIILNTMMNGKTLEEFKAEGGTMDFFMQPLKDVYLQSDFTFDIGTMGNQNYVILFGLIAVFIIILASINFMNLSTARSANRGKEVGVRKVLGSYRSNLVGQFLTESMLLSVFSFAVGLFLVVLLLPYFNDLTDKHLVLPLSSPAFIVTMLLSSLMVGVLAGLYPSFYLSAFNPIETLKGRLSTGSGNSTIRSGLVVFQFFISILLIIGTVAIYKQLQFIQNRNIGFEKDQVILLNDPYMLGDKTAAFKEEVKKLPNVVSASYSGFIPVSGYNRSDNTYWPVGQEASDNNLVGIQMWRVDPDYVSTMGMKITEGRDFNKEIASDSSGVILNERAFEMFGFKKGENNAIQTNAFDQSNNLIEGQFEQHKVLGVVEDFNFESMKENIGPLALFMGRSTSSLVIKLQSDEIASTLANIEAKWNEFDASLPFSYTFLDEEFANMYKAELKLAQVFTIFAGLAIFIGCLGLFALASFMAEQRAKEIGIRKVLGASVNGIVLLLSKQFSRLVILAFLMAVPLAWWGISKWLEGYNYKINIGWELFAIAGISAFLIAWLTVAYHSIKAAISNPVDSLKNE